MVGFTPEVKKHISNNGAAIAGAIAGSLTRTLTQPFDFLKIRFQLQLEKISPADPTAKYIGLKQAVTTVVKEENIFALWKGHSPSQFLVTTYGLGQWYTFEYLTKEVYKTHPEYSSKPRRPLLHFCCGAIAGCVGTVMSMPFDVIRTRLVAQGTPRVYKSTLHAAIRMSREEGFRTFYRGMVPALIQIAPYVGFQFSSYTMLSNAWKKRFKQEDVEETGIYGSLICGMLAGIFAKTAVYPLDLVKKRLQIQGFEEHRKQFGRISEFSGMETVQYFKMHA